MICKSKQRDAYILLKVLFVKKCSNSSSRWYSKSGCSQKDKQYIISQSLGHPKRRYKR